MKWRVHQMGALWCAHRGESGKPRVMFESWRQALTYALARTAVDRLEAAAEYIR